MVKFSMCFHMCHFCWGRYAHIFLLHCSIFLYGKRKRSLRGHKYDLCTLENKSWAGHFWVPPSKKMTVVNYDYSLWLHHPFSVHSPTKKQYKFASFPLLNIAYYISIQWFREMKKIKLNRNQPNRGRTKRA